MTAPWSADGGIHEIPLPASPGRLWLCGKQVVGPDADALLQRTGATAVVCLVQRHEIAGHYPAYVAWLEQHAGEAALWYPTPDLGAPPLADARRWLDHIDARLQTGEGVVVHCAAGRGRAGTIAVGLLLLGGMTMHDALAHVRQHRPGAGPEAGAQMTLIRQLAEPSPAADEAHHAGH
jgi:protein-tyrosine phosphatase